MKHSNQTGSETMSRVTDLMENHRWVYWLDEMAAESLCMDEPRFQVSIVVEGESGHFPTGGGDTAPWYWDEETCNAKNAALGYSREEVLTIVGSSMFAAAD